MIDLRSQRGATSIPPDLVREQLAQGNRVRLRVGGRSMIPLIWPRSLVYLEALGSRTLKPGDVVAFELQGRIVCHGVIAVIGPGSGATLRTRGIANRTEDPPCPIAQVLGRVARIEAGLLHVDTDGCMFQVWQRLTGLAAAAARCFCRVHPIGFLRDKARG